MYGNTPIQGTRFYFLLKFYEGRISECNIYYVNYMVISCSTCQKSEKQYIGAKYVIYAVLLRLKLCPNSRVFFHKILIPRFSGMTYISLIPTLFLRMQSQGISLWGVAPLGAGCCRDGGNHRNLKVGPKLLPYFTRHFWQVSLSWLFMFQTHTFLHQIESFQWEFER